jgi:hypothetical protein
LKERDWIADVVEVAVDPVFVTEVVPDVPMTVLSSGAFGND